MRTPAGFDCIYFFGDYYRGRSREECRLIGKHPRPNQWKPSLCKTCPVPGILRANACRFMSLQAHVEELFLGLVRRVKVSAYCSESQSIVTEPHLGCGQCHPLPPEFDIKKP